MDLNTLPENPHYNAVAGPSSIPLDSSLFLLPPGSFISRYLNCFPISLSFPLASPRPPRLLESTQDLISRFHLLTAYDKFVRPFITQDHDPNSTVPPTTPAVASSSDKGKGRERDPGTPTIASAATPGTHHDPDDDEGRDGKKKKNTYRHLIKGVPGTWKSPSSLPPSLTLLKPGKHSIKKDDFLTTIIQVPPKQHIPITPFDPRTQTDAFTVSLEGLKGVCSPDFLVAH
jgi:hypothetical protein